MDRDEFVQECYRVWFSDVSKELRERFSLVINEDDRTQAVMLHFTVPIATYIDVDACDFSSDKALEVISAAVYDLMQEVQEMETIRKADANV